jgi:hypothetical protein
MGNVAVPELLRTLRSGPDESGAALALGGIIERRDTLAVNEHTIGTIKNALLSVIRNKGDYILRTDAIKALMPLNGEDIRAVMLQVRDSEPPAEGSKMVQTAAKEWLLKHP